MALTYTTEDRIMRLLKGRLETTPSSFGRTPIDPDLLDQVGEQAEAALNNVLRRLYQFPLQSADHPTLAEFVELRCVCRLIPVYYQRESVSDDRGIGNSACTEAEAILARLESGAIELDGEIPIPEVPSGLQRQQTFVKRYNASTITEVRF